MMGYSHSISAAASWLFLNEINVISIGSPAVLVVSTLACAGAGMLPDIDHKNGTIAHSLPPFSQMITSATSALFGGHRKGTHSLLGLIFFWGIAIAAERLVYHGVPWASLLITAYMGGLALRVFGAPGGWLGAIGLGYLAWSTDSLPLTPIAIGVGATIHIVGDALTTRGVNLLWPLALRAPISSKVWKKSGYMALPLLGDAGSTREVIFTTGLSVYIVWFALTYFGWAEQLHLSPAMLSLLGA